MNLADRIIKSINTCEYGIGHTRASKSALYKIIYQKYDYVYISIENISDLEDIFTFTFEKDVVVLKITYNIKGFDYKIDNIQIL